LLDDSGNLGTDVFCLGSISISLTELSIRRGGWPTFSFYFFSRFWNPTIIYYMALSRVSGRVRPFTAGSLGGFAWPRSFVHTKVISLVL
jgi:hypothetical protein